jgi:hypothetical protein
MTEGLISFIDWTAVVAIAGATVTIVVSAYNGFVRYTPWPGPGNAPEQTGSRTLPKSIVVFGAFCVLGALCSVVVNRFARDFVLGKLEPEAAPQLFLEGREVASTESLIAAIRAIRPENSLRSDSMRRFSLEIRSLRGDVTIELASDPAQPKEYLLFVPEFVLTSSNSIGRIQHATFPGLQ